MVILHFQSTILITLLDHLKQLDLWLFLKINTQWTTNWLDNNYPWFRQSSTWIPLYLFLILFLLINFGWKSFTWIAGIALTITVSDQLSSTLIKDSVARLRPCQNPALIGQVRMLLNHCSGGYSFTSSHATNHFAAAFFIFGTLQPFFKKWTYLFFIWAGAICYGQIYVGVHYPLDILGGALIGSIIGTAMASIYNRRIGLPPLLSNL